MKRKVLHIINGEHYAGAERVQDLLAARLPDFGYEAGFACVHPGVFENQRRTTSAPLVNSPMANRLDLRPALPLIAIARRENYRLIHTHTTRAAIIGTIVAHRTGLPMVHHLHGPTGRQAAPQWLNRTNIWLERRVLPHADAIIAVSHGLEGYTRQLGLHPDRVTVIPNGVPILGPLAPRSPPDNHWTIGIVALFRPGKGLEVLLDALHQLLAKGRDFRLLAVGPFESPAYHESILDRANRLELTSRIVWRGFQNNVYGELSQMDLFVLPSLSEGMPMVLLEAMAAGVPIVATRIDGVSEVIRDGVNGLLAEPGDANSLVERILQLMEKKADWGAIRTSAYHRQVERYSDTIMAQATAHVYDRVLDSRHEDL